MFLLAIDPAKSKPIAMAAFSGDPMTLQNLYSIPLASLLHNPSEMVPFHAYQDKVAMERLR